MRKINLLALLAILAGRVYASAPNLFPRPNPSLGGTQQNNHNNAGVSITNSDGNNGQSNPSVLDTTTILNARSNRVETTRYLRDNFVSVRFSLDTLEEDGNNLMDHFPRDLLMPSSITSLRVISIQWADERIGTVTLSGLNEGITTVIASDMVNSLMATNGITFTTSMANGREINPQLRNRVSAFLNSENHIVEFYLRRDITMAENSRRGIDIFTRLLSRFGRDDVLESLRSFGFFEENASNILESITDENGNSLNIDNIRNSGGYRIWAVGIILRALNTQPVDVYPDDNPVSDISVHTDSTTNSIIMRIVGDTVGPNEMRILNNFLGQEENEENSDEE